MFEVNVVKFQHSDSMTTKSLQYEYLSIEEDIAQIEEETGLARLAPLQKYQHIELLFRIN